MIPEPKRQCPQRFLPALKSLVAPANAFMVEALVAAEAALFEGFENCGYEDDSLWAEPLAKVGRALDGLHPASNYRVSFIDDGQNANNRRLFVGGEQWAKVYGFDPASAEARAEIIKAAMMAQKAPGKAEEAPASPSFLRFTESGGGTLIRIDLDHVASVDQKHCYPDERRIVMVSGKTYRVREVDGVVAERHLENKISAPSAERLRRAMESACDLLAERKHGHAARSPAHNARLTLETAIQAEWKP